MYYKNRKKLAAHDFALQNIKNEKWSFSEEKVKETDLTNCLNQTPSVGVRLNLNEFYQH